MGDNEDRSGDRRPLLLRARDAEAYQRFRKAAEWPMLALSVVFAVALVVPLVAEVAATTRAALETVMWFIWAAFVVEYLTLFYLAPDRLHMVRTYVLDLVIIVVPFLRPLRILRLLRLVSVLARAGVAFRRVSTRPGFRSFLLVALGVVVAGAGALYAVERGQPGANIHSFGDALWWAVVTSTTVGYGDHFPVTAEGRAVAVVLMLVGIAVFGVVTANIAAYFAEEANDDTEKLKTRLARIEELLTADGDTEAQATDPSDLYAR